MQTAFIHDFPKLPRGEQDITSEYGQQMKMVLRSLSVPPNHPAMRMMSSYDMRSTCEARIVASMPTTKPLTGWAEISTAGLGRLSKVVHETMNGKVKGGVTLEAQVRPIKICRGISSFLLTTINLSKRALQWGHTLPDGCSNCTLLLQGIRLKE